MIVDSVAALVPRAEIEGEMGDSFVGLQARLMSQALRKLTGAVSRSNTALVFTNQLREKIGVMFGNPETTPGGRALKFYASIRMDIRRIETLKNGTDAFGSRTRVKVVKNKVASPFRIAEFDILYNEGISREGGLLDVGIASGVLSKTGAWFNYGDTRLGNGREAAREFLKANPGMADAIEDEIRGRVAAITIGDDGTVPESESATVGVRDPGLTGWPRLGSPRARPASRGLRPTPSRRSRSRAASSGRGRARAGKWSSGSAARDERRGRGRHAGAPGADRVRGRRGLRPVVGGAARPTRSAGTDGARDRAPREAASRRRSSPALRDAPDGEQPATDDERAAAALDRHLKGRPLPEDPKALQRLGMFLVRRGFEPGTARRVLQTAIAESTGTESTAGGGRSAADED